MKKALFISLLFISCSQPFGKVHTKDEKSIIIKKIFEEVSAERIDYLKDVFSIKMGDVEDFTNFMRVAIFY